MTIKELRMAIKDLDENMRVGGIGYFGEFLECHSAEVAFAYKERAINYEQEIIFCILIENPGEEPD